MRVLSFLATRLSFIGICIHIFVRKSFHIVDHTFNVHTGKKDVLWNYISTFMSMASNFLLIPLLLVFLSNEEIGLWYVFVTIAGFAQLLEFGFTYTLARNLLFCLSGVRKLSKQGGH